LERINRKKITAGMSAKKTIWSLDDLYNDIDDPAITLDQNRCLKSCLSFVQLYWGKVNQLTPEEFYKAVVNLESIKKTCKKITSFTDLAFAVNTRSEHIAKTRQSACEFAGDINQKLLFFTLEWTRLPDKHAERIINHPQLKPYRHYLGTLKSFKSHTLSIPEEKILAAKDLSGNQAWKTFFDKIIGNMHLGKNNVPIAKVLSNLYHGDRNIRKEAAFQLSTGLDSMMPAFSHIFNATVFDKTITDDIRSYPKWLSERNLKNKISDTWVSTLVNKVIDRYDIVHRYYKIKKQILGYNRFFDYDRYAPLPGLSDKKYSWLEAKDIVLQAFYNVSPQFSDIAKLFFDNNWIHAKVMNGKVSGAFSWSTVPKCHPYILLNFTNTYKDMMVLAHELGHGIHQYLCRGQWFLNTIMPATIAEVPAVFAEIIVFDFLFEKTRNQKEKTAIVGNRLEDIINTLFRQIALFCFEDAIHKKRRSSGALETMQINNIWMLTQKDLYKNSVYLQKTYGTWWAYIPHFIHAPGYVYAYALAELTALLLHNRYKKDKKDFVFRYVNMLKSGGSCNLDTMLKPFHIDMHDPCFFDKSLDIVETLLEKFADKAAPNR
jgi:oligoendopeptidase F